MRCPICKKEIVGGENPYRPFCGERCQLIDLDNWLSGRYQISTPLTSREELEATPAEEAPETESDAKANGDG
jgi:endogenous inhibitor of DNA gyrase (YacG/DUF329 family)